MEAISRAALCADREFVGKKEKSWIVERVTGIGLDSRPAMAGRGLATASLASLGPAFDSPRHLFKIKTVPKGTILILERVTGIEPV